MKKKYANKSELLANRLSGAFMGVILLLSFSLGLNAQVTTNYQFASSSGTYTPLAGGTILGDDFNDDDNFTGLPIGFSFKYNCSDFTTFSVQTNGFIIFGSQTSFDYTPISAAGTVNNVISALARDMQSTEVTGQLSYLTTGTAPNRVLTVDWLNYKKFGVNGNGDNYNFQIKLYETSNVIEVVYGSVLNNANLGTFQVGLRGTGNTDYRNRTTTTDWSATTAGATNAATSDISSTVFPASGTTFQWSPTIITTLTQSPGLPSCSTGSDINVTGTPAVDQAWYWQTSSNGTSLATQQTGSTYTVFANGTYYLRQYNTATSLWTCLVSSITITNFPLAATPPVPTADVNPSCVSNGGSVLTAASAPMGTEYFWQEMNAGGTSAALPATSTYAATTSGTYYLAAREIASQCWSNTSSLAVVVSTFIPQAPIATDSIVYRCINATSAEVNATAPGSGVVSITFGSNVTLAPGASLSYPTNLNIPAGATITSSVLSFNNVTTTSGTWPSDIGTSMTGAANLANTTIAAITGSVTNAGPYTRNPTVTVGGASTLILNHNYSFGGPATFGSITLTISYTVPATSVSWYDASTAGTQLGTGSPFETVGTSVLPTTATAGTFPFYAESASGGCVSASRTVVNVNISPVAVELTAADVTCNNGNDGTFTITNLTCGSAPFTFSVNGGAFGAAPDTLEVGTYSIVVMDGSMAESAPYIITIGNAPAPSGIVVNTYNNTDVDISWIANGSEIEWNVEWGMLGFTPGTGTEIGMATATDTNYVVTGLMGDTEYEFYVSANCGLGTTAGSWISISQTTACDPIIAQGWCESFDSDSPTQQCWTVLNSNADFTSWNMDDTDQPANGDESASINTDFNGGANNDWLITPLISLTGNEVLTFAYSVLSSFEPNDFEVLLSTTGLNPADFTDTLMYLDSYSNIDYQDTSINLSAFSGNVYVAFHIPNGGLDGWVLYIDDVCVDICIPAAGTDGMIDVCRLDTTLDLNTVITQGETNGVWKFTPNQTAISGSDLTLSAIPNGTFTAEYIVTTSCTMDTTVATFNVFPASSAGTDGVLNVCRNQQLNLLSGLAGIIDLNGTWYNPSDLALASGQINSGTLPGQFNYSYVTNNGVCPNDTSNIVLNVSATCDALGLEEFVFEGISIYPNPSNGIFTIANATTDQDFSYEIVDLNGRVIINATEVNGVAKTEVNLSKVENGIYMIRVFNTDGERMERIVKQ